MLEIFIKPNWAAEARVWSFIKSQEIVYGALDIRGEYQNIGMAWIYEATWDVEDLTLYIGEARRNVARTFACSMP